MTGTVQCGVVGEQSRLAVSLNGPADSSRVHARIARLRVQAFRMLFVDVSDSDSGEDGNERRTVHGCGALLGLGLFPSNPHVAQRRDAADDGGDSLHDGEHGDE